LNSFHRPTAWPIPWGRPYDPPPPEDAMNFTFTGCRPRPALSGRQGQLLAPASHTTVRTVPYTAVHAEHLRRRCSWTRLTRP
jgi:hypothetical protein